ncbi:hypothetical protein HAX54_005662 [Datura stramonium]|uniref:Uncharacterized protein n=1 Tax=Datura stramonium TaxID=4076 RepID=A0ABS8T966_DATST|nr:hypothetical protein [Datura stramonium]
MEQKMKELDSDFLVSEVFVPDPASSSEFTLGPCFRDGFPSKLEPFYPLAKGEKLLFCTLRNLIGTYTKHGGLRPHVEEISATLYVPKLTFTFPKSQNGKRLSYRNFLEVTMKKKGDSISQQQNFEGQEKDERPSKKAKRELFRAGSPDITANNQAKSAINITKHSPGVHGSSHSSGDAVNFRTLSLTLPKMSAFHVITFLYWLEVGSWKTSSSIQLVNKKDASPPRTDVKTPALKMSQYSAQVLNRTKAEAQKLLMMPLQKVVLPENYSVLVAALPIYAASLNLSVEKARVLDELEENLPSLFSNLQQAKWKN